MLEANDAAAVVGDESSSTPVRKTAKPKRAWLAALLSLLIPGLGHIYSRRPYRGLAIAAGFCMIAFFIIDTRVLLHPPGLLVWLCLVVLGRLLVAVDAARSAKRQRSTVILETRQRFAYFLVAALIITAACFPDPGQLRTHFRAYRIDSGSMCPTICPGERIVADPEAYKAAPPQRADLVMMSHANLGDLFLVKRVIAVGGDTVKEGPQGQVLVNGNAIAAPPPCGESNGEAWSPSSSVNFEMVKVPAGQFFVVGDNLDNSFDSRFPEFGLVTAEQIRGKPLYISWSGHWSRLGCKTR